MQSRMNSASLATMAALAISAEPPLGEVYIWKMDYSEYRIVTIDDLVDDPKAIANAAFDDDSKIVSFGGGNFPFVDLSTLTGYVFCKGVGNKTSFTGHGLFAKGAYSKQVAFVAPVVFFGSDLSFNVDASDVVGDFSIVAGIAFNSNFERCSFYQPGDASGSNSVFDIVEASTHNLTNCHIMSQLDTGETVGGKLSLIGCQIDAPIAGVDVVSCGSIISNDSYIGSGVKGTFFCGDDFVYSTGAERYSCKNIFTTSGILIP